MGGEAEGDAIMWITAACRAAITALPRGERGVEAAILWLHAIPEATRLGLGDLTDSAPGLFRVFVAAGLIPSCPSDSAMTGAIRLIASVSALITQRSPRTWTAWIGSARDPDSPLATALRGAVTPAMLAGPGLHPSAAPRRAGSIRTERDRLAAELALARDELDRERRSSSERIDALAAERDRMAADLVAAREERNRERRLATERRHVLTAEHDRLATDLVAARKAASAMTRERDEVASRLLAAIKDGDDHARLLGELREQANRETESLRDACRELEALRDRQATAIANLDRSLREAQLGNRDLHAAIEREKRAHEATRQRLRLSDKSRPQHDEEIAKLKARLSAASRATEAMDAICVALRINSEDLNVDAQLNAILTTVADDREKIYRLRKTLSIHRIPEPF
ncbi:MAG: hypothetical protein H6711_08395 [Myxococcales bacterium]|nr:hypothetical protein [Myxococcales bacterium]